MRCWGYWPAGGCSSRSSEAPPYLSTLRSAAAVRGPNSWAAHLQQLLTARSEEFRAVWNEHEIGIRYNDIKRYVHPEVGALELTCQTLLEPDQSHFLLVYTAVPGSESYEKLQLLSVLGSQRIVEAIPPKA
jgi:hypothetical protein